jgi:hypothetical protein
MQHIYFLADINLIDKKNKTAAPSAQEQKHMP